MIRIPSGIVAAVALCLATTAVVGSACPQPRPFEALPESTLASVHGADKTCAVVFMGDCDSVSAAATGDLPCGNCTAGQVNQLCDCCDNGGLVNLGYNCNPNNNLNPGIDTTSGKAWQCGVLWWQSCQLINNQFTCGGNPVNSMQNCGPVTEYSNQPTGTGPGGS